MTKLEFNSLQRDLSIAWNTRNEIVTSDLRFDIETDKFKRLLNSSTFYNAIDPYHMDLAKELLNTGIRGTFLSLCVAIAKGKLTYSE